MSAKSDQKQRFSANQKWGKQIVNNNEEWELGIGILGSLNFGEAN